MSPRKRACRKQLKARILHPVDIRVRGVVQARFWLKWRPGLHKGEDVAASILPDGVDGRYFDPDFIIHNRRWFRRLPADAWSVPADLSWAEAPY